MQRFTPKAEAVVDPGQTAFLPGRWIGDNILKHLGIIDYNCRAESKPGCVLFLDFEKAYDGMDRGWLMQCLQRMGFPPAAQQHWVQLMLADTKAGVSRFCKSLLLGRPHRFTHCGRQGSCHACTIT